MRRSKVSFSRLKRELASQCPAGTFISRSGRLPHPYGLESWQTAPAHENIHQTHIKTSALPRQGFPAAGV
ncbi:MAG TPA: hypothetical protein ENF26_05495 [Methanomicrobia archaeon]|nr:hypothetical protein [Methanomicrobia archaeon]HEX59582.1 hypothetical protein [Methanomicrobia archaeon]